MTKTETEPASAVVPDNFALLRRIALNLLKAEMSTKRSIQRKRLTAGWDAQYLLRVLEAGAQQKGEPPAG
ncbi:MAG: hypothetical protein JW940_18810 [Polyangiaceae bacterium]|nr:hypothetical protein [Polyangiaceae bacterium]